MRNCQINECENGYMVDLGINFDTSRFRYVFTDWSEMMEFIEDYFADEVE